MKNNILVIAAHPDDETLGCGGTILKHINGGDSVNILILSDGETSRISKINISKRINQAKKVAKNYQVNKLILEKIPDNKFDTIPLLNIVKIIEKSVWLLKPNIIYTHNLSDLNIDHKLTFQAVITACRPIPQSFVKKILSFEVLSSTEWQNQKYSCLFNPNEYNCIDNYIQDKIRIMKYYANELRNYPHPRSSEGIKILAQYRGMQIGVRYAEAFEVVRNLID